MKTRIKMTATLLLTVFALFSLAIPSVAKAQTAYWWKPTYQAFSDKVGVGPNGSAPNEIFGERYTYAQVSWIISSLVSIIGGPVAECAASGGNVGTCIQAALAQGGVGSPVLSALALGDTLQNTKPASGVDYVAQKLNKFNIVTPAYAQNAGGYGFSQSLLPIQPLWVATRNAAFALTTFAIIILAFMIMFRAKISPQVVISAQSALPKVAIGLVFITFSYAIAGFMVDIAFVVQGIIAAIASASGVIGANAATGTAIGPLQIFNQIQDGMGSLLAYGIAFIFESMNGGGILAKVVNTGNFVAINHFLFPIIDTIIALILMIVLLIVAIRVLWLLILTYGKVIFLVLGGPFIALLAIAGQGSGIGGWVKKLASELSVFVAIGVLIMFAHIIFYSFGNGNTTLSQVAQIIHINLNPFGVNIPAGLQGAGLMPSGFSFGNNTSAVGLFVSLAIVLSIPKLASAVRDQIANGRGSYGFGIGEAVSPISDRVGDYGNYRLDKAIAARKRQGGQFADVSALETGKGFIRNVTGMIKKS